ncbi:MAG: tRNA 2-thiouridine(34) synthase MnmA [Patescibacteria group bacterium]|jgi:tRNA-specific 2-thiouridylase
MAKIIVAMSGGVDSSVAAFLLKKAGHEIKGVFMKNYESLETHQKNCPWKKDQDDAKKICQKLKIPFETWNFERQYSKLVLGYFYKEYRFNRTPNPDILCNKEIKFGVFLKRALKNGYAMVATGHYARIKHDQFGYHLLTGVDKKKDQSYFLSLLNQKQLSKSLFPIGNLTKTQVRKIALKVKLPNASKPDSQGICFIGKIKLKNLLSKEIKAKPGNVMDSKGQIIGRHKGLSFYTIGQRQGINIPGAKPYYVAGKIEKTNTLIVAIGKNDPILKNKSLIIKKVHWIIQKPNIKKLVCSARIRYRQPLSGCRLYVNNSKIKVDFKKPIKAITPGQFIVFYKNQECLGSAVIENAL